MTSSRRGLTLLEVVLSVTILGSMTVAALPLLLGAQRVLHAKAPSFEPGDLARIADEFVEDPGAFALEDGELPWPGRPDLGRISIRWDADEWGTWITFESGGLAATRWKAREEAVPHESGKPAGGEESK